MEAQGGAEVRRVHIVYFLSRNGRIEHPHLIRVHHLSRNGVKLRDVKRWIGELRGKEIPDTFSWSYKRRYKSGYVWQDLQDDDLITPISDNEYVLKGSEIPSITIKEEKVGKTKDVPSLLQEEKALTLCKEENHTHSSEASLHISTKSPSEIEEESPSFVSESSTLTDDSRKIGEEKSSGKTKHERPKSNDKGERPSPFYSTLISTKSKKRSKNVPIDEKTIPSASIGTEAAELRKKLTPKPQCTKSKSSPSTASKMLKNLISCGDVETKDSAVLQIKKQNKPFLSMCSSDLEHVNSSALSKRDSFGGSQRVFGNPTWAQHHFSGRRSLDGIEDVKKNKSKLAEQKSSCAAYKPVKGPNCSQCGKLFKPERMHAHMKSCKGLKASSSKASTDNKAAKGTAEFRNGDSFSGHLVTD